jgi:hypothetical protein
MKRNFNHPVVDFDGRPHSRAVMQYDERGLPVIKDGVHQVDHWEVVTLRFYALDALGGRWPGEERIDGTDRMRVYHKICYATDGLVDLDASDPGIIIAALTNQGRSFVVVDAMQKMLAADPTLA